MSGSPIDARNSLPVTSIILGIIAAVLAVLALWFIFLQIKKKLNSEKYIQKQMHRQTSRKDVVDFGRKFNLSETKIDILWKICSLCNYPNVYYNLKTNEQLQLLFKEAYPKVKDIFNDAQLNDFFLLLYKLENSFSLMNNLHSTKQLKINQQITLHSTGGNDYSLYLVKNNENFFQLEIPEFLFHDKNKPKILTKLQFSFKTSDGFSCRFESRIIRYENNSEDLYTISVAHCDSLKPTTRRKYKRGKYNSLCFFSPIGINTDTKDGKPSFIYYDKKYEGNLMDISAGGCCIVNPLAIKKNQHICIHLDNMGIQEKIVGVIKNTTPLPDAQYALHIQFIKISAASKNKIFALMYNY